MDSDYSGYKKHFSFKNITGMVCGPLLLALGLNVFIAPHNIAFGGVTGLTIIIQNLTGIPLAVTNLALSVLVMFVGWLVVGRQFLVKTIIPTLLIPLWLWLTSWLIVPALHIALSIIGGALLMGLGVGVVMAVGGSTAGPDAIAMALHKKFKAPIPLVMIVIDTVIILCGLYIFGWQTALFSACVTVILSLTVRTTMKLIAKTR